MRDTIYGEKKNTPYRKRHPVDIIQLLNKANQEIDDNNNVFIKVYLSTETRKEQIMKACDLNT